MAFGGTDNFAISSNNPNGNVAHIDATCFAQGSVCGCNATSLPLPFAPVGLLAAAPTVVYTTSQKRVIQYNPAIHATKYMNTLENASAPSLSDTRVFYAMTGPSIRYVATRGRPPE